MSVAVISPVSRPSPCHYHHDDVINPQHNQLPYSSRYVLCGSQCQSDGFSGAGEVVVSLHAFITVLGL